MQPPVQKEIQKKYTTNREYAWIQSKVKKKLANIFHLFNTMNIILPPPPPRKHSLGRGYIRICLSVCPDQLPHLLSDFHQTLWNLRSWCVYFAV
jgi:hypothetical protein